MRFIYCATFYLSALYWRGVVIIKTIVAVKSKYFADNEDILIFEGSFKLSSSGKTYAMQGKVSFTYLPKPRIQFSGKISDGVALFNNFIKNTNKAVIIIVPGFKPSEVSISAIGSATLS